MIEKYNGIRSDETDPIFILESRRFSWNYCRTLFATLYNHIQMYHFTELPKILEVLVLEYDFGSPRKVGTRTRYSQSKDLVLILEFFFNMLNEYSYMKKNDILVFFKQKTQ